MKMKEGAKHMIDVLTDAIPGQEEPAAEAALWDIYRPLLNATFKCRKKQRAYAKSKKDYLGIQCKEAEQELDQMLANLLEQKEKAKKGTQLTLTS